MWGVLSQTTPSIRVLRLPISISISPSVFKTMSKKDNVFFWRLFLKTKRTYIVTQQFVIKTHNFTETRHSIFQHTVPKKTVGMYRSRHWWVVGLDCLTKLLGHLCLLKTSYDLVPPKHFLDHVDELDGSGFGVFRTEKTNSDPTLRFLSAEHFTTGDKSDERRFGAGSS